MELSDVHPQPLPALTSLAKRLAKSTCKQRSKIDRHIGLKMLKNLKRVRGLLGFLLARGPLREVFAWLLAYVPMAPSPKPELHDNAYLMDASAMA